MAAPLPSDKVKEKEFKNYQKMQLSLFYLKTGLDNFIQSEVNCLHEFLKNKIYGKITEPLSLCTTCHAGLIRRNKYTGCWEYARTRCKSKCDVWFRELLELHSKPLPTEIFWDNSDVRLWPSSPWECAKVFMPKEDKCHNASPKDSNLQALLTLIGKCKYFCGKLSTNGHHLLDSISIINRRVHDGELKLSDVDLMKFIQEIIQLLEDPECLKSLQDCKDAVCHINEVSREDFQLEHGQNPCLINQNQFSPVQKEESYPFPTSKVRNVYLPHNPRPGKIINWTVEEMTKRIGEKVGGGACGIVYKANTDDAEMFGGSKREFVIKKIKVTEYDCRTSYEKEILYGRILHPFINPVIARAEDHPTESRERFSYIMLPYMPRQNLRHNIDEENRKVRLSEYEPNSKIWMRCIYQIALAVDYLHTDLKHVRGPVFHRDLTSSNILLDENFNIRIGDFGVAVEAKNSPKEATQTRKIGTKGYHPPNMNEKYNASYDVFIVGVDPNLSWIGFQTQFSAFVDVVDA